MEEYSSYSNNEDKMMLHKQLVIALSNDIYGAIIRFKEIHLNTSSQTVHLQMDNLGGEFVSVYDKLLEAILGITDSKLEIGSIKPNIPSYTNATQVLKLVKLQVIKAKEQLIGSQCAPLHALLDDFLIDVNKHIYLSVNR